MATNTQKGTGSNPFWAEAISGTELPKGLNLVQQTMAQLRTKIVSAIETLSGENEK